MRKNVNYTNRGFITYDFVDKYGKKFTIRQSSADMDDFWIFSDKDTGDIKDSNDLLISPEIFKEMLKTIKVIQRR